MGDIGGSNGRRVQLRRTRKDGCSKAKRTRFLTVLAQTCNATLAAEAAGISSWAIRDLRKRDGEFALLYQEAIEAGYERLEGELLARALAQVSSGDNPTLDEIVDAPPAVAFDAALALKVLQLRGSEHRTQRRASARGGAAAMTESEIDVALLARIAAVRKSEA